MAIREILTFPNPLLLQVAEPVERVTSDIQKLMDDMLETMYSAGGFGLAAVQIGVHLRIVVMDLAREGETSQPRYFVNPQLSDFSEDTRVFQEGCLSVPNLSQKSVERPEMCRVDFLDYNGEVRQLECDGLLATCIQHEVDHLDGILYFQRLSRLKRHRIEKSLRKDHERAAHTQHEADPLGSAVYLHEFSKSWQSRVEQKSQRTHARPVRNI